MENVKNNTKDMKETMRTNHTLLNSFGFLLLLVVLLSLLIAFLVSSFPLFLHLLNHLQLLLNCNLKKTFNKPNPTKEKLKQKA